MHELTEAEKSLLRMMFKAVEHEPGILNFGGEDQPSKHEIEVLKRKLHLYKEAA